MLTVACYKNVKSRFDDLLNKYSTYTVAAATVLKNSWAAFAFTITRAQI